MEARPEIHPLFYESQRRARIIAKQMLLCPGPVMLSDRVRNALLHPEIGHREEEFSDLLDRARLKLSRVFGVKNHDKYTTLVITGSGSAANESVLSSIGSDKRILILTNGEFGERLVGLAEIHQLNVIRFQLGWGEAFTASDVERAVEKANPDVVAMVHHETSTGMLNPIEEVGKICKKHKKLFYVDAVSSLGAEYVNVEKNHIAFCTASSNKALSSVCGLSFVCGQRTAFESLKNVKSRTAYLNLYKHYQYETERSQTPNTPAVTALFALDAALDDLLEAGLDDRVRRCRMLAGKLRDELRSLGLEFIIPEDQMSSVLTTAYLPENVSYQELREGLKRRGFIVYGGKGPLDNRVFQVANIGTIRRTHINDFTKSLKWVLSVLSAS
jgi:2-aminoethylphosphonate-pyruvate transaminase